jgi:uncharacterized protein YndB with AHSA1/START domain
MQIQVSTTIDRPIADVWRWYAEDHVRNHPRWDPDMELQQISEGPIGLGTKIRRRNVRFGAPVDGEMEVVEWDPERAIGMLIHDANMQMRGRTTFQEEGPDTTLLTIVTDIPDLDESKASVVSSRMQRTIENVKSLVESDP